MALADLKRILSSLDEVQKDLEQIKARIATAQEELAAESTREPVSAGRLEMAELRKERLSAELTSLRLEALSLESRASDLEREADAARDNVAKAHRAFVAAEGESEK